MEASTIRSATILIAIVVTGTAWAQTSPNAPSGSLSQTPTTSAEQTQAEKFNIYTSKGGEKKPDAAQLHQAAMKDAGALVRQLQLSCMVTDASYVAQGPTVVNGKTVKTTTFEVTCGNGMGYFVVSQEPEPPTALSCFTAEAARAADVAAGKMPGVVCRLPADADIKMMAMSIVNHTGHTCTVRDLKRIGQSAKSNTEYNEVTCADGTGYMLASALPGSTNGPIVVSCHNSALQGIPCKMSDNGVLPATDRDFKNALVQHNVPCDAVEVISVGREAVQKRHVVEFLCPQQQPAGLVAFIPLNDNSAKFETVDCVEAAKRGVICKLTHK